MYGGHDRRGTRKPLVVFTPSVLVVHSDVPAKNLHELVALARAQPGNLTYVHAGVGTPA